MTRLASWQDRNSRYLGASIEWLRLKLLKAVPPATPAAAPPPAEPARRSLLRNRPALAETPRSGAGGVSDSAIAAAAAARTEAAAMDPPPGLVLLATQFGLSDFERDIVLLAAAVELDSQTATLCARIAGDRNRSSASFGLALAVLDDPSWSALSPQGPLRYWRLIELGEGAGSPVAAPLRINERVLHYLKGLSTIDVRVAGLLAPVEPIDSPLPPSQAEIVQRIAERLKQGGGDAPSPVILLLGADEPSKLLVARGVTAELERRLYRIDTGTLPAQPTELAAVARLWQLESALSGAALYIDAESDALPAEARAALDRAIGEGARIGGLYFLAARQPPERSAFENFAVDVTRPTPAEQDEAWREALAGLGEEERSQAARRLAAQFSLNLPAIRKIAADTPPQPAEDLADRLWDECRNRARPRVDSLAQRIEPRVGWDDLVVHEETEALLREIVAQVQSRGTVYTQWSFAERIGRGLGISALFSGESGTGKTLAAEVIAGALRLPLYRIDLSQIVDKYIGESEKNLQRLFDRMEGAGAILFFDEADALFGKRSEVRDSHDRYANIEVNYLLQRMESYTGLAILATNMRGALDPAFTRRLRFIVPFGFPGPAQRRQMWEKVFPADTPKEEIDFDRLARLNLAGASIRNVALNAAFLAAHGDGPVTTPLVLRAARAEFRKMDLPIHEAEFAP